LSAVRRPPVAALLSFLIPGLGQLYNREYLRGVFWLLVTPGLWIASAGLLGWVLHVLSAATAYHRAEFLERRHSWPMGLEV
jgi:TM2 domain-containing membrane protein YozV